MRNLFDSENYPDAVPEELIAGSFFAWTRQDIAEAYPVAEYTLAFRFTGLESPIAEQELTAVKTGGQHVIATSETGAFQAGEYRWFAVVTRDSDSASVTVEEGLVTIRAADGDDSTHTYRVLKAIQATLEGTATQEQSRIEIGGRVLENRSVTDLLALEREYSKRWKQERARIDRKAGRSSKSRVLVKMEA